MDERDKRRRFFKGIIYLIKWRNIVYLYYFKGLTLKEIGNREEYIRANASRINRETIKEMRGEIMLFIRENKDKDLEVYFEFYVVDEKRKKCQCFNSSPTVISTTDKKTTNQQINKEAVLALREKIDKCLKDLEFCIKNQTDEGYLLRLKTTREIKYEMTNHSEW